ncbi:MAG: FecR domain-containing protein, partial [Spirochaetales bacterium]|nr:FecR domain-containing protein [Spirochaetales bacterium]
MTKKLIPILAILLLAGTGAVLAESSAAQVPAMIVEYYENSSGAMFVRTSDGAQYEVDQFGFGEELPPGATLVTLDGDYAELRLEPNGTIIRVAENTNFTVEGLQGRSGAAENTFSVAVGKLRAVVAKSEGARYRFKGATAVCGVRGTKLELSVVPGMEELAHCIDGLLEFSNAAGQTISIAAGQAADALAAEFVAFTPPASLLDRLQQGLDFQALDPDEVPGYVREVVQVLTVPTEESPPPQEMEEDEPEAEVQTPKWLEKLMEFLGLELGAVTLESKTYAKAVLQPHFALGKLKMALYLPIYYQNDLFDTDTWYPENAQEWTFGSDYFAVGNWQGGTLDLVEDLFLKFRYIQYGEQRDPFFVKFGSLGDITIGHGSIMRDYANDADFPAIRKMGLNLGFDAQKFGVEAMVSDAANPQVFGARAYYRPGGKKFPLAIGLSGLTDLNPEKVPLDAPGTAVYGMPIFVNFGADLDFPVIDRKALSMILFGDAAAMVPYLRRDALSLPGSAGWHWEAFWDGGPRNWGAMAGLLGNILMLDYRLEYRYSVGSFKPSFYGPLYDRQSTDLAADLVAYLSDPADPAYANADMGVFGELGYTLEKVFYITGSYYWPWPVNAPASA